MVDTVAPDGDMVDTAFAYPDHQHHETPVASSDLAPGASNGTQKESFRNQVNQSTSYGTAFRNSVNQNTHQ